MSWSKSRIIIYNTNSEIKFKTSMLRSSLYNYSDVYLLMSGTITVTGVPAGGENSGM